VCVECGGGGCCVAESVVTTDLIGLSLYEYPKVP
jgi:hypothetical protein